MEDVDQIMVQIVKHVEQYKIIKNQNKIKKMIQYIKGIMGCFTVGNFLKKSKKVMMDIVDLIMVQHAKHVQSCYLQHDNFIKLLNFFNVINVK